MEKNKYSENLMQRTSLLEMSSEEFRTAGHELIDQIATFLSTLRTRAVTQGMEPREIRNLTGDISMPEEGISVSEIIRDACKMMFEYSLFNGSPRFWGYITSSASPVSALADLLASSVNANVGAYILSPVATEIEKQTIRWIAEFIGYDSKSGGTFVSGGNMANFIGYLTARYHKFKQQSGDFKDTTDGELLTHIKHIVYCPEGTHTWIQKAARFFGHPGDIIRWIPLNDQYQINCRLLREQIAIDRENGHMPFLVIGNAGSVSLGVVDPLNEIAGICRDNGLWFHVDGAYGAPAASLDENSKLFNGLKDADSIALDPHKWLYSALEAGCILVHDPSHLKDAFSFHPDYYNFDGDNEEIPTNFHEFSLQNSRGFKALKVWMGIRQAGKKGYRKMISDDIELARRFAQLAGTFPEIEVLTCYLSITTFRYVPDDLNTEFKEEYLNFLNEQILNNIQIKGEVFVSNAIIEGMYCLRMCIVNFRTLESDIQMLIDVLLREGKECDRQYRKKFLYGDKT